MSTFVVVNTLTHAVTFVANNLLVCLQEIIKACGLNPGRIAEDWTVLEAGLTRWLETQHLTALSLEVYSPATGKLVGRWDFSITYGWTGDGGSFWLDPDQVKYAIHKQGLWPSTCAYRVIVQVKPGSPELPGWSDTEYLPTTGFVRQSIGTTVNAGGLGAAATYYRRI